MCRWIKVLRDAPLPPSHLLLRIEPLLLKAKALDFVEVRRGLRFWTLVSRNPEQSIDKSTHRKGHHIVGGHADNGLIGGVAGSEEGQGRLAGHQLAGRGIGEQAVAEAEFLP